MDGVVITPADVAALTSAASLARIRAPRRVTLTLPVITPGMGARDMADAWNGEAASLLDAPDPHRALIDMTDLVRRAAELMEEADDRMHPAYRLFAIALGRASDALDAARDAMEQSTDGEGRTDAEENGTLFHAATGCGR